jgi:ABC-type sugar transport system permease subunit
MGYASAIAVTLFFVIGLLTALQFILSRRWVHYT